MKGIVLAGGLGTRLRPLTYVTNKHLLPVYDKPMIYYPIETLKKMGITEILIVTGGEHIGDFIDLLKDGEELGISLTYRAQVAPGGIAQALALAEGFASDFMVILGDNYFAETPKIIGVPTIYTSEVPHPERFGVYDYKSNSIVEKPKKPLTKYAVTGLYHYDYKVFNFIRTLKPSERGELEITDVNNWYLKNGGQAFPLSDLWSDMGTFESLFKAAEHAHSLAS